MWRDWWLRWKKGILRRGYVGQVIFVAGLVASGYVGRRDFWGGIDGIGFVGRRAFLWRHWWPWWEKGILWRDWWLHWEKGGQVERKLACDISSKSQK
jgi:hypothetical protein